MDGRARYESARRAHPAGTSFVGVATGRTVAVVCADPQLRRRICIAFDHHHAFAVVASSPTVAEGANGIESAQPDLVTVALDASALADAALVDRLRRSVGASVAFHVPPDDQPDASARDAAAASVVAAVRDLARPPTATFDLDASPDSPSRASRLVATHCEERASAADHHTIQLVACELVTNAVAHGTGPIKVAVDARPSAVRVEVTDQAPALPRRGSVVGELSSAWGLRCTDARGSTAVWAEISAAHAPRGPSSLADLNVGTRVEVQNHFIGSWANGFTVVAAHDIGLVVRRDSDASVLPPISRARIRAALDH